MPTASTPPKTSAGALQLVAVGAQLPDHQRQERRGHQRELLQQDRRRRGVAAAQPKRRRLTSAKASTSSSRLGASFWPNHAERTAIGLHASTRAEGQPHRQRPAERQRGRQHQQVADSISSR